MTLQEMVIINFRQFQGDHIIKFAGNNCDETEQSVTVLYGKNGRGKTGIFRALMFALYGDSVLSQDEETKSSEIYLVNRHMLEKGTGRQVEAQVKLSFIHHDSNYEISRKIVGLKKDDGKIIEQKGSASLRIQNPQGNTETFDSYKEILDQINMVLDYRVREYFLFDGEKIERLTRASSEQKKTVSAGIRNLLNIDGLEKAIKASTMLVRDLDSEIQKKSSGELQKVINHINEIEDQIDDSLERIKQIDLEINRINHEKRDIDLKLEQYKEIRDLVDERKLVEEQRDEVENEIMYLESDCKIKTYKLIPGFVKEKLQRVYDHIEDQRNRGDIPPIIGSDMIQKLLEQHECICGRGLEEGSDPFNKLLDWMKQSPKSSETDAALRIWKQLSSILRENKEIKKDSTNHLVRYANLTDQKIRHENRLEAISVQIGGDEREDAASLDQQRRSLEIKHISLLADQKKLDDEISDKRLELGDLEKKRTQLEGDASIRDTLMRRSLNARKVKDALTTVFSSFKSEAGKELGILATNIMNSLLDDESRKNLKEIIVEDDYSLQLSDKWNGRFLANISAGQRQIMSLSFITALAQYASGEDKLHIPLFMDTPFGRLSQEHRENLLLEIPNRASQWILLTTDTELRRKDVETLLTNNKLGRFYQLNAQEDGTTKIDEHEVDSVLSVVK